MSDEKKWFLARAGQISGPHAVATIEAELQTIKRHEQILFWTRGQAQWLDSSEWKSNLQQTAFSPASRETKTWSIELDGFIQQLSVNEVNEFVEKNIERVWDIRFKPEKIETWMDISALPSLMSRFDVARADERGGLLGSIKIDFAGKVYDGRARDISTAGLGVAGLGPVPVGEVVPVVIDSPSLVSALHVHAQVIYRNTDGQAGLRFVGLTAEHTTVIVEYLKRFIALRTTPNRDPASGLGRVL
ncbi:MAG: PilZ domain-containing protein [Proteobacteria bacterium]|nr:MAG: PilZ domain-containing protein [Pseudomonadota bacterium]